MLCTIFPWLHSNLFSLMLQLTLIRLCISPFHNIQMQTCAISSPGKSSFPPPGLVSFRPSILRPFSGTGTRSRVKYACSFSRSRPGIQSQLNLLKPKIFTNQWPLGLGKLEHKEGRDNVEYADKGPFSTFRFCISYWSYRLSEGSTTNESRPLA